MSWISNLSSFICTRRECRLIRKSGSIGPLSWTLNSGKLESRWNKQFHWKREELLMSTKTPPETHRASHVDHQLDLYQHALTVALNDLEKIISNGLSKSLTPALMRELERQKKTLRSSIALLSLARVETSSSGTTNS